MKELLFMSVLCVACNAMQLSKEEMQAIEQFKSKSSELYDTLDKAELYRTVLKKTVTLLKKRGREEAFTLRDVAMQFDEVVDQLQQGLNVIDQGTSSYESVTCDVFIERVLKKARKE